MTADVLAVIAAYFTAFIIRFHTPISPFLQSVASRIETGMLKSQPPDFAAFYLAPDNALRIIILLSLTLCSLNAFFGLYSGRRFLQSHFAAFNLLKTNSIALLLFVSYLYLSRNQFHPRSTFLLLMVFSFLFSLVFRKLVSSLMHRIRRQWGFDRHPVLLAGEPGPLDAIEDYLRELQPHGLIPAGRIPVPPDGSPAEVADRLVKETLACSADTLCVSDPRLPLSTLMELLDRADEENLTVKIISPRLDLLIHQARIEADSFMGEPLIHFSPTSDFAAIQRLRRLTSVLFSLGFLILASPLFALVALLVKLTSTGPVLFIQERVGWDGRHFHMLKFRTMYVNASVLRESYADLNESGRGALFKIKQDPRITPMGRFLRKFSLDELPQFVNVLRGDMNVVGPRPLPVQDFKFFYEPWHRSRHKGLPGITGLWQVSGRSDLNFEQMCVLDVYYLHNASLSLDLALLFRTAVSILFAEGAY